MWSSLKVMEVGLGVFQLGYVEFIMEGTNSVRRLLKDEIQC